MHHLWVLVYVVLWVSGMIALWIRAFKKRSDPFGVLNRLYLGW